jgi:hypothetical protein
MATDAVEVIVSVENPTLREVLLQALQGIGVNSRQLLPDELLREELDGHVLILLETSDDTGRLIDTARYLYETWGETGRAFVQFAAYATEEVSTDAVVFALWNIGPEGTVIVQCYQPGKLQQLEQDVRTLICRNLGIQPEPPAIRPWWRWWS